MTKEIDYTSYSNEDLLKIYKGKGGIPLAVVKELRKRKLLKSYRGTFNSNMTC